MGLPEFILHRMLVPHSFRYEHSCFSFEIYNTYAAGTITRLKLIADGTEIPLDRIQYQAEGQPAKLAIQISPDSPAPIPTGIRINISSRVSANPKTLVLWAETKEAGIIQFTVKNDNKLATRKPRIPSFLRKPLDCRLDFDLANSLHGNKLLLGCNCGKGPQPNPDDAPSIQFPLLVFPSLNSVHGYRWTDGIGPMSSRTKRHDLGWHPQQDNLFGTGEFLQYCETNRISPVLAVDTTLTSAEEAASWVKYCNDSPQSPEGKARSLNGHTAPYAVKTWIITGNAWQEWELTGTSALTYARKIRHFVQTMRAFDNELKIGVLVKCLKSDDPGDPITRWNEILLNEVGQSINFIYWQIPIQEDGFASEASPIEDRNQVQETYPAKLEKMISRMQSQISMCIQNRDVLQAIDASRFIDSLDAQIQNKVTRMDQIDRALLLLDTLKSILTNCDSVTFLTLGADELQIVQIPPMRALLDVLASDANFRIVPVTVSSNSALAESHPDIPELDAMLLHSSNAQQFELIMANRHPERRLRVNLTGHQLGNIHLMESSIKPSFVTVFIPKFRKKGDSYELELPPHSITFASFEHSVKNG